MAFHLLSLKSKSEGGGSVVIMLALNLILLALFILLNSFAKPSTNKSIEALEGVKEGFDYRESGQGTGSDATTMVGVPWHLSLMRGIDGLIHNKLMVDAPEFETDATKLTFRLPAASFFAQDDTLLPERRGFLEDLAALTAAEKGKVKLTVLLEEAPKNLSRTASRLHAVAEPLKAAADITLAAGIGEADMVFIFNFDAEGADGQNAGRLMDTLRPLGATVKGEGK